jgi:TM2 domain-containing membrane protein YozV
MPGSTVVPPFIPGQSNRIPAGICGILLGAFGVHKFIAGLNTGAVIMLCVTVASFIPAVSCCVLLVFGPMVMGIIGLIEGIIYLCCTDEEFYFKYVVQKRQWF